MGGVPYVCPIQYEARTPWTYDLTWAVLSAPSVAWFACTCIAPIVVAAVRVYVAVIRVLNALVDICRKSNTLRNGEADLTTSPITLIVQDMLGHTKVVLISLVETWLVFTVVASSAVTRRVISELSIEPRLQIRTHKGPSIIYIAPMGVSGCLKDCYRLLGGVESLKIWYITILTVIGHVLIHVLQSFSRAKSCSISTS